MEISSISYKRCDVIKVTGRIDSETAPDLEKAFKDTVESGKPGIIFDMSEVDFISSRGLWVLLETQKLCKKKGNKLSLVNLSEDMSRGFDIAGIKNFIEVFDDITDAVGSY